jgi:hypothetical protein
MNQTRRGLITGLGGILAVGVAPAIVRAASLMPVNSRLVPGWFFTEMARTGSQDESNWTVDTYKVILSCKHSFTTTFKVTVDGTPYEWPAVRWG